MKNVKMNTLYAVDPALYDTELVHRVRSTNHSMHTLQVFAVPCGDTMIMVDTGCMPSMHIRGTMATRASDDLRMLQMGVQQILRMNQSSEADRLLDLVDTMVQAGDMRYAAFLLTPDTAQHMHPLIDLQDVDLSMHPAQVLDCYGQDDVVWVRLFADQQSIPVISCFAVPRNSVMLDHADARIHALVRNRLEQHTAIHSQISMLNGLLHDGNLGKKQRKRAKSMLKTLRIMQSHDADLMV